MAPSTNPTVAATANIDMDKAERRRAKRVRHRQRKAEQRRQLQVTALAPLKPPAVAPHQPPTLPPISITVKTPEEKPSNQKLQSSVNNTAGTKRSGDTLPQLAEQQYIKRLKASASMNAPLIMHKKELELKAEQSRRKLEASKHKPEPLKPASILPNHKSEPAKPKTEPAKPESEPAKPAHSQLGQNRLEPSSSKPEKPKLLSEDEWHPSKLAPNLRELGFSKGFEAFDIRDRHIDLVVAEGPTFCHKLTSFRCGDSDRGYGSSLSDTAIIALARSCPNLNKVYLESCTKLTDASFLAFLHHCPNLREISISGNDKCKGGITGKTALVALKDDKGLAKNLKNLYLVDQRALDNKAFMAATKARKGLEIQEGDSSDKWYDFGSITTWRGGKMANYTDNLDAYAEYEYNYW